MSRGFIFSKYSGHLRVFCYGIIILLTSQPPYVDCCFPVEDVFAFTSLWLQMRSLQNGNYIVIGQEADDIMTVKNEGQGRTTTITFRCLRAYSDHRYLIRIDDKYDDSVYQCLQFTSLTPQVVRQANTKENKHRKRIDCIDDTYTEDDAVLIAYHDVSPQPCPLAGGYQLIMHQGMAIAGHCTDSVQTYNPRIQFQCDGQDSGKVLVDFGQACEPPVLTSAQKMRGRHLTHLHCVSSWDEQGFKAVLLHMRDLPQTFWCLHYKQKNHMRLGAVSSDHEEFLSTFLTVDGRCSSQAFGDEDLPRNTSMFGFLASYRPNNDLKCTEKAYLQSCKQDEAKCFESTECPSICERCKPIVTTINCSFMEKTRGIWKTVNSRSKLEVTVEKNRLKSPNFGEFICEGPPESGLSDYTYPVVQEGSVSTCMPYYACAQVYSPATGMMTFKLSPRVRNPDTGVALTCHETYDKVGHIWPVGPEKTVTLINVNKLQKTACNHMFHSTYPTILQDCRIAVHECSGKCQTLNVTYDMSTCGNFTPVAIETTHTCYATMDMEDGVRAILTKSSVMGRYQCWVFGSTRLFIGTPEECNQPAVSRMFDGTNSHITYDPINAISLPMQGGNLAGQTRPTLFLLILVCAVCIYVSQR